MAADTLDLASFFTESEFNPDLVDRYAERSYESFQALERFDALAREYAEQPSLDADGHLRAGLAAYVLGDYPAALEQFAKAPNSGLRHFYAAQSAAALRRYGDALEALQLAARAGWDRTAVDMQTALIHAQAAELLAPRVGDGDGDAAKQVNAAVQKARDLLNQYASASDSLPEWHCVQGVLAELDADRVTALRAYHRALELAPDLEVAAFRTARLAELAGRTDEALRLYARLARRPRAHVNALINAALIHEDHGDYDAAAACLKRVLRVDPNHRRARLFLKSVESCREMVTHDASDVRPDPRERMLSMPIMEFELSVRARNCLKKMNVRTLGDLVKLREEELLAYKNFGETSLNEIRALLQRKGLKLGQSIEEIPSDVVEPAPVIRRPSVAPEQEALLGKSVIDLELSVRSRRCLQRLNVKTVGDLLNYTEADLLATRNFGVTSLNEIKARLSELGLTLATRSA